MQQKLTEVNYPESPNYYLSRPWTYVFPSSEWIASIGPIEEYVLQDMFAWLEAHSGLSHSFATIATIGSNTSALNTSTTSPSSASSKR